MTIKKFKGCRTDWKPKVCAMLDLNSVFKLKNWWNLITLYKLCAFPVSHIPIPSEDVHSRWGTSPLPVSHIPINGEDVHFQWVTSPFPVRMFIPLGFILTGNGMCLTVNAHPHPGMGMCLTENAHPHREWRYASLGMRMCLTGNVHSLYRVLINLCMRLNSGEFKCCWIWNLCWLLLTLTKFLLPGLHLSSYAPSSLNFIRWWSTYKARRFIIGSLCFICVF